METNDEVQNILRQQPKAIHLENTLRRSNNKDQAS